MATRVVHRVRCRKKNDNQVWADVKVVDAVTVTTPGGRPMLMWVKAKDANPYIQDDTGGNNGKGSKFDCTRVSHMELVESSEDANQKFYIEILDAIAFIPPTHSSGNQAGAQSDAQARHGLPETATYGRGPFALFVPENESTKLIVDKTGLGLATGSAINATRSGHVSLITEKGNTDDNTAETEGQIPPDKLSWLAIVKPDAVNFRVPGGNVCMILPKGIQEEVDSTVMKTDPVTGEPCPPDNADPNRYVMFPGDNSDKHAPSIGCSVKIPVRGGQAKPIDQGPLWWIERISPTFRPWFYYATINTPQAFSFFGNPGRLGNWGYRGFKLWNNYPVIWILARNNAIVPMGQFGSPSLDLCARTGHWDFSFPPVPSASFQAPPRTVESIAGPSQLAVLVAVIAGQKLLEGRTLEGANGIAPREGGAFGPFGILQMTHPPLGNPPEATPYGPDGTGNELYQGRPNIWQLTGIPQPPRLDPNREWAPVPGPNYNPWTPPSAKKAEQAARSFEAKWNAVAVGHNGFIQNYQPGGGVSNGGPTYAQPPGWSWAIPWFDGSIGHNSGIAPSSGYRASFQNGIPPGVATRFFSITIYSPATSWTLAVDQLKPEWWDTTHLEFYNNPLNAFFPLILPPFLWTNNPWTGSDNPPHDNPGTGP